MERLIIQYDWDDVLSEKSAEPIWIQYKYSNDPAINGKLYLLKQSQYDSLNNNNSTNDLFSVKNISNLNKSVEIEYKSNEVNFSRKFVAPIAKFKLHFDEKSQKQQPVLALDVTNGGLGVSSSNNGSLLIWLTQNGQVRRNLNGHIGDVNVCKFFPSGLVVLSGADDLRLKVWSAEDGSCPITLVGHTSGVNDFCIVEKGRNIVSVGRDGQCKLFDVGESKCLANVGKFDCVVNCCSMTSLSDQNMINLNIPEREEPLNEREIGTENKIVACACEDGYLRVSSLRARKKIFEFHCESSVNCCSFLNETTIGCGTQNGNKTNSWKEFRSSILCMQTIGNGFIASTGDGSCFTWNFDKTNSIIELTGPNFDPVYKVSHNQNHIFTCCRDGFIRKYDLTHLTNN